MLPIYIISIYFLFFFILGTAIKNNSIVDIGWGLGFVVTSWLIFIIENNYNLTALIANILVSIWGFRLFYHILKRNIFKGEDYRYKNWRENWGKWVIPRAFIQVYTLQAIFMYLVGMAIFEINLNEYSFSMYSMIGVLIWLIGYIFESLGDYQLKEHIKSRNKGLLTTGLWKYTRHPNYFGEALMWWGLFIFGFINNLNILYIISPIIITILVRFISGVNLLEKSLSKKEGWDEYKNKTNAFIPWFPKK